MQPSVRDFSHSIGRNVDSVANKVFNFFPALARDSSFELRSELPTIAGAVTVGAVAYFVFLGTTQRKLTAKKVKFWVSTGGASTQAGEVGLFSSPASSNGAAQTLTCLVKDATLDDLTGTGVKGNTADFTGAGATVDAGTHLWAGYRVDMASTEPTVFGLTYDLSAGRILSLAAQSAFVAGSTYAGGLVTASVAWQAPSLVFTCS